MQWPFANVDWLCLASFWLLSHTEFLTSIASIYLYITIRRSFCLMFAVDFFKYTKLLLTSFINGYLNLFRSLFHEFGFFFEAKSKSHHRRIPTKYTFFESVQLFDWWMLLFFQFFSSVWPLFGVKNDHRFSNFQMVSILKGKWSISRYFVCLSFGS